MQTKEDIEKWDGYSTAVTEILKAKGYCSKTCVSCYSCPFSVTNNGHGIGCAELGIWHPDKPLKETCIKYLSGYITFLEGKLVEIYDAD